MEGRAVLMSGILPDGYFCLAQSWGYGLGLCTGSHCTRGSLYFVWAKISVIIGAWAIATHSHFDRILCRTWQDNYGRARLNH